jgi:methylaspartate mutase epsilon subunit
MHNALRAIREAFIRPACATITVDAYTRVGNEQGANDAIRLGKELNGYPITCHSPQITRWMVENGLGDDLPIQIRHGSAKPGHIFRAAAAAGITAIEGGPVSYNFPYSRISLAESVDDWARELRWYAEHSRRQGQILHVETFAGCMLGQLCPPSLLTALAILEAQFFQEHGVDSVSLSHIQGSNDDQDVGGLLALRRLAARHLAHLDWHTVHYTWMGLFPESRCGAEAIIRASARIARHGGADRIIVKTAAEASRIPSISENVEALSWVRETADATQPNPSHDALIWADVIEDEAERLILATKGLGPSIGQALVSAFAAGVLDIPFCTHVSNRNAARASISLSTGAIYWVDVGKMPLRARQTSIADSSLASKLSSLLSFNRHKYDLQVPQ